MKTQKKIMQVLIVSVFLFIFSACSNNQNKVPVNDVGLSYKDNSQKNLEEVRQPVSPVGNTGIPNEKSVILNNNRLIIKTGRINLEIENYNEVEKKITETANKFSGYITNTSSNLNASGKRQGAISVRIPSDKFDAFVSEISLFGKIESQNISGNDVTAEYIDLEARQKTQRELESRLLELLNEKTAKLTDVVEVEQKLASVRENIESTEGRMRFLRDQSAFSTLTISLFEPSLLQTSSGGGFFYEIGEGVKRGLNGFTEVLSWSIAVIISFSPLLIFLVIIYIVVRKIVKGKKFQKQSLQVQS